MDEQQDVLEYLEDDILPVIRFVEPERWIYRKVVPIVYAILEGTEV